MKTIAHHVRPVRPVRSGLKRRRAPIPAPASCVKTPDQARAWLDFHGISMAQWAREHGFGTSLVRQVLAGKKRGLRGQSHNIAVALGMKAGVPTTRPGRASAKADRSCAAGAAA
jgi:gp16 family phage-associated protein